MMLEDLTPENKKQLIEFYKAIKVASKLIPRSAMLGKQKQVTQLVDQIIVELKSETTDKQKVKELAEKVQALANPY